jgi:hypothetical protein
MNEQTTKLYAAKGETITQIEQLQARLQSINQAIMKSMQVQQPEVKKDVKPKRDTKKAT